MPVIIEIKNLQAKIPLSLPFLRTAVRKILRHERIAHANLSIVFVSNRKMKALNQKYLKHNYATDVLTFPSDSKIFEGEIIVSVETALRQSKVFKTEFKDELVLYVAHGILHLLGYNDHSPTQIKKIRMKEKELMELFKK